MASSEQPTLIEENGKYTTSGLPGGEILRFTPNPDGSISHLAALLSLPAGEHLSTPREYGLLLGLAKGRGTTVRESHHLSKLTVYGWEGNNAVSCPAEFDPEVLLAISRAGYAAHSDPFRELTYALQGETSDPIILAVRRKWEEMGGKKTILPATDMTRLSLDEEARKYKQLQNLFEEDGLDGFVTDLASIRNVMPLSYRSLTAQNLIDAGVKPDSGLALVRSNATGADWRGNFVSADGQFIYTKHAISVAVLAQGLTGK